MDKVAELNARLVKLEQTIKDKDARDHFLKLPKFWLGDIKAMPEAKVMLPMIEQALKHAEEMVSRYGPGIRIVG